MTVRFTAADLDLFAAASHDRNPLHLSSGYGRTSQFGQQVVYGALGALAAMAHVRPPAGQRVASMTLEFSRAVFLDTDYQVVAQADGALLMDGTTRIMKVSLQFAEGVPWSPEIVAPEAGPRRSAATFENGELVAGLECEGQYRPDPEASAALFARLGLDPGIWGGFVLSAIVWASYAVGMEIPGERALFFRYTVRFDDVGTGKGRMSWQVRVKGRNSLNLLRSAFELRMDDRRVAEGQVDVLLRPLPVVAHFSFPESAELAGKVALVTGASRGFGAALTRALVMRGARVLAGFQQSRPEAERLREELAGASGSVELVQGDASDRGWCTELKARYPKIDFLILNACPTVLGMKAEAESIARLNAYVSRAFELVSVPLGIFGDGVTNRSVLISSVYVETLPKEFPHYVAAKAAAEALLRAVARQHRIPGYLIVRPPKLLTDMTNTPYGAEDAIAPEGLACQVVDRLCRSAAAGEVETLARGALS